MRKIWDSLGIILGVAFCLIALYNFVWMCGYFQFTNLIITGVTVAIAVMLFMKKKNTALGVMLCALGGVYIINGLYNFASLSNYYYLDAGDMMARLFVTLIYDALIVATLVICAVNIFIKDKETIPWGVNTAGLFCPVLLPIAGLIADLFGAGSFGAYVLQSSFMNRFYSILLPIVLILLVLYIYPNYKFKTSNESLANFTDKAAPFVTLGIPAAILLFGINSWIGIAMYRIFGDAMGMVVFCEFLFIIGFIAEIVGIACVPFLLIKFRGNEPGERPMKDTNAVNNETKNTPSREEYTYKQGDANSQPTGLITDDGYIAMWLHVLLSLVTCGVWAYIWIWKTTKYLNKAPGYEEYNPTKKLLLCLFVPFYSIYWYYKMGQRMEKLLISQGKSPSDMTLLCLIFGIFIQIVAMILLQDKINDTCRAKVTYAAKTQQEMPKAESQPDSQSMKSMAEDLTVIKKLYDDGILTEEEYERKKAEILSRP